MIKGIIFDFDGTLVRSEAVNVGAAKKIFEDLGQPLERDEEAFVPGKSPLDFIPRFAEARGIHEPEKHRELYELGKEHYDALWHEIVALFPDTEKTLRELHKKGIKLGIATSSRKQTIETFLKRFGFEHIFDFAVTSEDVKQRKPHPEPYLLATEKMGFPKNELLVVEDTLVGLAAAKSAGLRCAVIPNEYSEHEDFSEADYILSSLGELLKLL